MALVTTVWLAAVSQTFSAEAEGKPAPPGPPPALHQETVDRAIRFLAAQQEDDGGFSPQLGIGPTALVTLALVFVSRCQNLYSEHNNTPLATKGNGDGGFYYHTFAKALRAFGVDQIEDAKGVKHDWRRDLIEELARRQQADGSWVNKNNRWMEGDPALATAFAILALSYCQPAAAETPQR
jgi:hypothetical protein